jgi:hypothetical protein
MSLLSGIGPWVVRVKSPYSTWVYPPNLLDDVR